MVQLVVTHYPSCESLSFLIHENLKLLNVDSEIKGAFTSVALISFWSATNLKNVWVTSKVYSIKKKLGSEKCNS